MHQRPTIGMPRRLRYLVLGWALCLAAPAIAQTSAATVAASTSSARFDALFARLDSGDLSSLDEEAVRPQIALLGTLLPRGDAHRRRLLDTLHCGIDFDNSPEQGQAFARAQLSAALRAKDTEAAIRFHYCLGDYLQVTTTTHKSLAAYQRGIDLAVKTGARGLLAWGLLERGGSESLLGIYGKALADLLKARRLFMQLHMSSAADQTLQEIGIAYRRLGDTGRARQFLTESVAHAQRSDHEETLIVSLIQLGYADQDSGDHQQALANMRHALRLVPESGDRQMRGSLQMAMASVFTDMGQYAAARHLLDRAKLDLVASGDNADMGTLQFEYGRAYAGSALPNQALIAYNRAESAFNTLGNRRYQQNLYKARAQLLESTGHPDQALADYKKYLAAHEEVQRHRASQQAQLLRAQFDSVRSQLENARLKSEQALKEHEVETLVRARRWQRAATLLLAVLLALLALLVVQQVRKLRRWKRMASLDPLTGVANRRGLEQFLVAAMQRARTTRKPLSVLAIDLDRFKRINDVYGHATGDRALVRIAQACQLLLRDDDLIGRIGGEEFLVVLPGSALTHACEVAERLRARIETLPAEHGCLDTTTTISIGIAEMTITDTDLKTLQQRADEALYRAKADGRNRTATAPMPAPGLAASRCPANVSAAAP